MFLISAPSRAARLTISARGMTLSIVIVSVMAVLPEPAIPMRQSSAVRRSLNTMAEFKRFEFRSVRFYRQILSPLVDRYFRSLLGRHMVRRAPDRRRIERRVEILRGRPIDPCFMEFEIGQKQIAADPCRDGRDIPLEAQDIADRQPEADECGRVEDMNVLQIRRAGRFLLQKFKSGSEVGVRPSVLSCSSSGGVKRSLHSRI